jgi:long-chain acyl-CoA synthetase
MTGTTLDVLARWLHQGDEQVAARLAIATRTANGWSELTYRDLDWRAAGVSAQLAERGVQPGDPVVLLCESGGDWVAAFLGILRRGAVAVPLDLKLTADELAQLWARSRPAAAIVSKANATRCPDGPPLLDAEADFHPDGAQPDVARALTDPAVLVWTSGTTGRPKGVVLSLANVDYVVEAANAVQGTRSTARWLSVLPPNHLLELSCGLLPALATGSSTFVARTVVPHDLAGLMAETRASQMVVVPMVLKLMQRHIQSQARKADRSARALRSALRAAAALPSRPLRRAMLAPLHRRLGCNLRAFYCGGAPLDPELVTFFDALGLAVYAGYGLTEAAPTVSMNTPRHHRLGSVGRPLPGTEVRIGDEGEILVRSPGVMVGYWDDEGATAEVIDADGWLHSGDLGRLDEDGYLYVTGRIKTLIVLDTGKKVQPEEVETALARSDLFAEVCVVGRRRPEGGEQVCAVVVPTPAFSASYPDGSARQEAAAEEVRRLTAGLSGYKRPALVRVVEGELPKSAKRAPLRAEIVKLLDEEPGLRGPNAVAGLRGPNAKDVSR